MDREKYASMSQEEYLSTVYPSLMGIIADKKEEEDDGNGD